jgi:hypothetical protein
MNITYKAFKLGRKTDPKNPHPSMVWDGELFPGQSAKAYVHDFAEKKNEVNDGKFIPKIGKCVWIQGKGFYDYVRTSIIEDFYIHEDYENSKDKIVIKPENAHLLNGIKFNKDDVLLVTMNSLYYLKAE